MNVTQTIDAIFNLIELQGQRVDKVYLPHPWFVRMLLELEIKTGSQYFKYRGVGFKYTPAVNLQIYFVKSPDGETLSFPGCRR